MKRPQTTLVLTCLASLFATGTAAAAIVVWDPADVDLVGNTSFRLDTGEAGSSSDTQLFEAADFELSYIRAPSLPFRITGLEMRSTPFSTAPGPGTFIGAGVATNQYEALRRLALGDVIDANLDFAANATVYNATGIAFAFDWDQGDNGYIGLELSIDGQTHYGWAEFTMASGAVGDTLHRFAYETTPNTAIAAGAVPEPGTLALVGLGGGLLLIRRKGRNTRCWG